MAKLLCAFVLAALVFQVSALPWHPSHWIPSLSNIEWISKLNPLNWFGGCNTCELQGVTGPCRGNETRWFYNVNTNKCETFTYGGCKGNKNNFHTRQECVKKCKKH